MVFSYSIKSWLLYYIPFGKGNRHLSLGYYAFNRNEGITYGSLKIARKKTFFNGSRDFSLVWKFLGLFLRLFKICLFLTKTVWVLKRISFVSATYLIQQSFFFPLKVADLEKQRFSIHNSSWMGCLQKNLLNYWPFGLKNIKVHSQYVRATSGSLRIFPVFILTVLK